MNVKKTVLLLTATAIAAGNLAARQISIAEAEAIASKYAVLSGKESGTLRYAQPKAAEYYVFATESGGFVIVSGDSEMTELVAYSDESSFDSSNENMMSWLGAYSGYVEKVRKGEAKPYKKELTAGTVWIEPLVTAKWGQMEPFNNLCPFDISYDQHAMAGCVAISMAQIFHFWKWPPESTGTHTYVHDDSMQGGHQYVVDGYDSNGFVHINWGWNGVGDGYYDIDFMCPDIEGGDDSLNFNYHQSFVTINHTYDTPTVKTQRYLWMLADEVYPAYGRRVGYRTSVDEVELNGSFDVECHSINNLNSVEYNGEIAMALFDADDNLLSVDGDNAFKISALGANRYLDIDHEAPVITVDGLLSGLENGNYTLRAVSREDGREDWQRLVSNEKISVQVNDGIATLYTPTYAVSIDEININDTAGYDEFLDISVTVSNKSDNADSGVLDWMILNPEGRVVKNGSEDIVFGEDGKYEMALSEYIDEYVYGQEGEYMLWLREFKGTDGRMFDIEGETEATFTVEDVSGVKTATGKGISITANGHNVKVAGTDATAEVFDISGRTVIKTAEREFSIGESGIYIVKAGNKIEKITIK